MGKAEPIECHSCGEEYKHLAAHWGHGCQEPKPTDEQIEIVEGLLMGDGSMVGPTNSRHFRVSNTNKQFLGWFDSKMGVMSTGIKTEMTPEQHAKAQQRSKGGNFNADDYQETYYVKLRSLDCFEYLDDWYENGRKEYPKRITLTPMVMKMWYVSDGTLVDKQWERPYPKIASPNEIVYNENEEWLTGLFDNVGIETTISGETVKIRKNDVKKFFDWIGEPVPGFEYKWPHYAR